MNIGERIKESRQRCRMLQSDLAARIGVKSSGIISNWERGLNKPNAEQIVALCRAMNISASYLLDYSGKDEFEASPEEIELIGRFRCLDHYGKTAVKSLIDNEAVRCSEQSIPAVSV